MKSAKFYMADTHCCGHIRGEIVAREVNKSTEWTMDCKTMMMLSDVGSADVMIFQRQHSPSALAKMRFAQEQGIKCIFDIDDDLFNVPSSFQKASDYFNKDAVLNLMETMVRESDVVTVSTEELAKALKPKAKGPIVVIPNGIDEWYWDQSKKKDVKEDAVVIGWMASESHRMDTPLISTALHNIMEKHDNVYVHTIGWIGDDVLQGLKERFGERVVTQDWVDIADLPEAMSGFSIGLAPLLDIPFNRCKSNIKFIQYGTLGIPCVASGVTPYHEIRHGVDGFIAGTPEEWERCIESLVIDKDLRKRVGKSARDVVVSKYNIGMTAAHWMCAFDFALEV